MQELVLVLREKDKYYLADIRCYPDIKVAVENNLIWVRIINPESIDLAIQKLPAKEKYFIDNNLLFPLNSLTPIAKLPDLNWLPIAEFIIPEFPIPLKAPILQETYQIKLITTNIFQKGEAILTDFSIWKNYIETAPEIRLKPLHFAVSENKKVIITGQPLPPVIGDEYWLKDNILLPCGYNFEIPVISSLIAEKLNPNKNAFILFDKNGNWEKIINESFVPASRSAVRITAQHLL